MFGGEVQQKTFGHTKAHLMSKEERVLHKQQ
jgi:hypothetical protein